MNAMALRHRPAPTHRPHTGLVVAITLAVIATVSAVVLISSRTTGDGGTSDGGTTVVTATPTAPAEAIEGWVADHRDEVFPGAEGPFLGSCETQASPTGGLCSALREDLGDVQLHIVGAAATDWGADLLLVRDDDGAWAVGGVSPWPTLGTRYDGPPWSPLTALTTWWYDRAAERYGAGAVHLRSCADAEASAADPTGQPLLCSVLVDAADEDGVRTYDSGLAGAEPDVRITVAERPDHTWVVTSTLELG